MSLRELVDRGELVIPVPSKTLTVPEWGDQEIELRGMSAIDHDRFLSAIRGKDGKIRDIGGRVQFLILSIYQEGERVLSQTLDSDAKWLNDQPTTLIQRLYDEASKLNGDSAADVEGNSETTAEDDSSSD